MTSDGRYVVAGGGDKHVYLFNKEGKVLWKYKTGDGVNSVAITPDGKYIVAGDDNTGIYLLDRKGILLWKYKTNGSVKLVVITPDGRYIVGGEDENIYLLNKEGDLLWEEKVDSNVNSVAITPSGGYIVAGCTEGNVYLYVSSQVVSQIIEDARKTILQIKTKYDVREAESLLSKAEFSFQKEEYSKAVEFASKAKEMAIIIGKHAEKAERIIENTKKIISKMKSNYNITEAELLLYQAESAFEKGYYSKTYELAVKAKSLALDIDQDGIPNEKDFTPYINDYHIYISIITTFLLSLYLGNRYYTYRKRKKEQLEKEKKEIIKELKKLIGEEDR